MPAEQRKKRPEEEPNIAGTSGTDTRHERRKAAPDVEDMTDPEEVWKDAETTPAPDRDAATESGPRGRVADSGDLAGRSPSPYSTETQADAVARQTKRTGKPKGVEKPKQ